MLQQEALRERRHLNIHEFKMQKKKIYTCWNNDDNDVCVKLKNYNNKSLKRKKTDPEIKSRMLYHLNLAGC